MTRVISKSLAGILQELELERPLLVTKSLLSDLKNKYNVASSVEVVAARLKEKGWLLSTGIQGVWEFVPAEIAGVYSTNDPLLSFRAFYLKYPTIKCALTFHSAAWIYGDSDRAPSNVYVAAEDYRYARLLNGHACVTIFRPNLPYNFITNISALARESVIIQMAAKPLSIPSWASVPEWLPGFCAYLSFEGLHAELANKSPFVSQRLGYLVQGTRPDIADEIYKNTKPKSNAWFGDRKKSLRYDKRFMVADTLLPFDPREMD